MNAQPGSAYTIRTDHPPVERHTLSILVDNEPGVLARVIGLFSGRGYNIDSLTVSETEHEKHLSRITIVTQGTPDVIDQITAQVERLVPVHRVVDLSEIGEAVELELALIKVVGRGESRLEALRLAQAFDAETIDASLDHFIFEIRGRTREVDRFIDLMTGVGLSEVSRTGAAAMARGPEGIMAREIEAAEAPED
ncbi:MAG: acetolactate synthase small subunit [Pseudomonadota bacterium]